MQASNGPISTSGARPEQLDAITAAGVTDVENFEHDFRVNDVSSTEIGQLFRERAREKSLFQPICDFECVPEPHLRLLTRDASQ